ncbi:MAG TPA: GWxTD domain-containing protein, partial [Longimicrobiales bacterium]|nr:GWxTD domain-containing protein [Longimicrobiales bacterium]
MSHEPEALVEYGLLLRKQHMSVDTRRVLDRALELAEEQGRDLPPRSRARLHFGLAKVYERWWEDWHNAVWAPPTAEPVRCFRQNRGSFADRAVSCPEQLWTHVERHVSIEDERHEERLRMMEHLREALEADPSHVEAAVHLLGHLADAGEWEAYMERAGTLVETAPAHPWAWIFLGLGLHEQAREEAAEGAFQRGLALLPEEGRRVFRDVRPLLTEEAREGFDTLPEPEQAAAREVFYRTKDPVFLTEENERRLEHWSRVAWAELKFGAPASGLPGWETPRGRIWIRYGRPARRFNLGPGQIYWLYGPRGPVFVFEKTRTYRRTWMTDLTFEYAEDLESTAPEHYRPRTVSALHPLPHQRVRFRGSRPELTRVEIYARPPLDSLAVAEGAPLEAGVFVFDGAFEPVWERRHHAFATEDGLLLTYRFELPRGAYHYGLEARLEAGSAVSRPLARARERLTTTAYPRGTLALSDLLLARRIVPRTETPRSREELVIDPSRTLRFQPGEPVHMYFEVYGLDTDASGLGRYRARLAVEDSTRQNVVERIVSAFLPNLIRPEGGQPWV